MLTQMVVNPEMLRFRSITFLALMTYIKSYISSQDFFHHFFTIFIPDGKHNCYGNLFVKMHGVLGIQAIKFQLDPFPYAWCSAVKIFLKKYPRPATNYPRLAPIKPGFHIIVPIVPIAPIVSKNLPAIGAITRKSLDRTAGLAAIY